MKLLFKMNKGNLGKLIDVLISGYRLFGPTKTNGLTGFAEIESHDDLKLASLNTEIPAKGIFFPQTDTIFDYTEKGIATSSTADKPVAIFGIRPCDAASLSILNGVFNDGRYEDLYWSRRYDNALILTVGCNEPPRTCFCNWMNLGPFSTKGSDVFLTDLGDNLLVESCSEKGKRFLEASSDVGFQKPAQDDLRRGARAKENAESLMSREVDVAQLKTALERVWDSELWEELSQKCLSCAACTYLCPTCHCFDIQDERAPGADRGRRIRIWDSCMFSLFTQEASGHNPRSTTKERLRQRIMHKFSYFPEDFGEIACVGCGRCVRSCPVNQDIREILKRIEDEGQLLYSDTCEGSENKNRIG